MARSSRIAGAWNTPSEGTRPSVTGHDATVIRSARRVVQRGMHGIAQSPHTPSSANPSLAQRLTDARQPSAGAMRRGQPR